MPSDSPPTLSDVRTPKTEPIERPLRKRRPLLSWRRLGITLAVLFLGVLLFYWWQPYRVDWIERHPATPPPRVSLDEIGLIDPRRRVLLVTAHPDDDAFYVGGTLFRLKDSGASVRQVVCTDGDKGYYWFNDSESTARIRQEEELECAKLAGIDEVAFLSLPDGRMTADENLVRRLEKEISEFKPEVILSFDAEYPYRVSHRDHRATGEAVAAAVKGAGFRGWLMCFATLGPTTAVDITNKWQGVENLLAIHKSQFYGERLRRIRGFVKAHAMEAGERFGPALAEQFRAVSMRKP